MNDEIVLNLKNNLEELYRKSAMKNGLIDLTEIMDEKLAKIFKGKNYIDDIIIKSVQMRNGILRKKNEMDKKYLTKNNKKKGNK